MKKKVSNSEELARAIKELETIAELQRRDVEKTYFAVAENLKPINLVKSGVRSVFSGEHKEDLFNALIGLGTGFLSRRLILGKTHTAVGKTVGRAIEWGMAGLISKNADMLKEKAGVIIDKLFRKNKQQTNHSPASLNDNKPVNP